MKISVALCTYNGARFLSEQLASLLAQTRLPSELVVCDDDSTDKTLQILADFQSDAPFPMRIHVNPVNLGPAKNFEQAISLCEGDLIALCDQDDVWLPEKLDEAESLFNKFPDVDAVFSDGEVVNAELRPLKYTLWSQVGFTFAERQMMVNGRGLDVLLKHVTVTGATLTIRASLRQRVLPIPPGWMHDAWIALIASASGGLRTIPAPLILYRQHDSNEIGARRRSLIERWQETLHTDRTIYYAAEIARYRTANERLLKFPGNIRPDTLILLEAKLRHLRARANLPTMRLLRILPILTELTALGYRRYSFGWQVAVKDFLLPAKTPT